jgi:hypothetical protein
MTGGQPCACPKDKALSEQRAAVHGRDDSAEIPPAALQALSSPGQAMEAGVRAVMEPRLGFDLGRVRIHTDESAAKAAESVNALAFTMGNHIVFGRGQHDARSRAGRQLLAHELTHVFQQARGAIAGSEGVAPADTPLERQADEMASRIDAPAAAQGVRLAARGASSPASIAAAPLGSLQRLVRASSVTCLPGPAGIASPHTGSADRRASTLLDTAITRIINAQAVRAADPTNADVVAVGNALRTIFRLDPAVASTWTGGLPDVRLPLILRRLQAAKDYIDSVVFTINCIAAGANGTIAGCTASACDAGTEAFSCHANPTAIDLCPLFWAQGINQRGRVWMHEVMHITFGFIEDWDQPDVDNAHCYAQFVALLNGFNSPAGFRCH